MKVWWRFFIIFLIAINSSCDAEIIVPVEEEEPEEEIETDLSGIKPGMYKASADEFLILTINLHTYQESNQEAKFDIITDLIGELDVDFVALQECAQHKNSAIVDGIIRDDNMALILQNNLMEEYASDYEFAWEWAHYGWNVWEEGVAVFSKYPLIENEDRYVSSSTNVNSINSRKVIYGAFMVPGIGRMHLFSAHTHWRTSETDEQQNIQINNIRDMVIEKDSIAADSAILSLICGDFNVNPTSSPPWNEGYTTMMAGGDYKDSFLEIYPDANNTPAQSAYNTIGGDFPGRIDYIFMKENDKFRIEDSQIVFRPDVAGVVSDHFGVLSKISYVE